MNKKLTHFTIFGNKDPMSINNATIQNVNIFENVGINNLGSKVVCFEFQSIPDLFDDSLALNY